MKRTITFLVLAILVPVVGFGVGTFATQFVQWLREPPPLREGDFQELVASVGSPLVLLSTTTCPWCEKTRQWLQRKGTSYRDCVVDRDEFARQLLEKTGIQTVPQLLSANRIVTGYHEDLFDHVVSDAVAANGAAPATIRCNAPAAIGLH